MLGAALFDLTICKSGWYHHLLLLLLLGLLQLLTALAAVVSRLIRKPTLDKRWSYSEVKRLPGIHSVNMIRLQRCLHTCGYADERFMLTTAFAITAG